MTCSNKEHFSHFCKASLSHFYDRWDENIRQLAWCNKLFFHWWTFVFPATSSISKCSDTEGAREGIRTRTGSIIRGKEEREREQFYKILRDGWCDFAVVPTTESIGYRLPHQCFKLLFSSSLPLPFSSPLLKSCEECSHKIIQQITSSKSRCNCVRDTAPLLALQWTFHSGPLNDLKLLCCPET